MKRSLVRTLSMPQLLMLGIGGTMGAGVFVLTGHAAGRVGPWVALIFLLAGLQSLPNALSYAELASSFPFAGGGYSYISRASRGLLPFSVGWVSWLSNVVYGSLSALGAAYSLQLFFPFIPTSVLCVGLVALFTVISVRGSQEAGRTQMFLTALLVSTLALYVISALVLPDGFSFALLRSGNEILADKSALERLAIILQTVTMVNVMFVGYEVIATTAEEAKDPGRNIPRAIVGTIAICALIYCAVGLVTVGLMSVDKLANSVTPLADAAERLIGPVGAWLMGAAGIIATLTSLNASILSAARVSLALGRDGYLPGFFARIHPRLKTPLLAILISGTLIALASLSADEIFLSYISNFGFMYLVFFTNVSVLLLRRRYPDHPRPFRTPFYPVTPLLGCLGILIVEAFTESHAMVVGVGIIVVGAFVYLLRRPVGRVVEVTVQTLEAARHEILVALANPLTAESLVRIAVLLGRAREDATLAALSVVPVPAATPLEVAQEWLDRAENGRKALLNQVTSYAYAHGVPIRPLLRAVRSVGSGILGVAEARGGVGLILLGWQGQLSSHRVQGSIVKEIVRGARCNVAVLRDRGIRERSIRRVMVPVGGGPHARLALRIAWEILRGEGGNGTLTALRILPGSGEIPLDVERDVLQQIVEDVLGEIPANVILRLKRADDVVEGILAEAYTEETYDLIAIGASEEWALKTLLFGSIPDRVAEEAPCSVLMVRKYEPATVSWLRRTLRR